MVQVYLLIVLAFWIISLAFKNTSLPFFFHTKL